jgi:hypothetical protein
LAAKLAGDLPLKRPSPGGGERLRRDGGSSEARCLPVASRIRDRDRYRVSGPLRDRKDRASPPLAGAPGGGRDARSGRRGSHRLRDGKAYPRSGVP